MDVPPDIAFENAWNADDTDAVIAALRAGANANARSHGAPVLHVAALLGRKELVGALLDAGADINGRHADDDSTALMGIAALGVSDAHLWIMRQLLGRGADVNAHEHSGQTALDLAVASGNVRSAEVLLAHGARGKRSTMVDLSRLRSEDMQKGDRSI
jgi:ankyrin repeat protein